MFNTLNNPNTVHIFDSYGGMNPFDPINLAGAIDNTQGYDVATHGILSAVIRYFARCDNVVEYLSDGAGCLCFITLDCAQGYHQIRVYYQDQKS